MRLTDPVFEAEFIGLITGRGFFRMRGIEGAQGIFLWCPCAPLLKMRTHGLVVPFANPRNAVSVPSDFLPLMPRWSMFGSELDDLTLSPSVDVGIPPNKCWHGFIRSGEVT